MGSSRKRKAWFKISIPLVSIALLTWFPPAVVVSLVHALQEAVEATESLDLEPTSV